MRKKQTQKGGVLAIILVLLAVVTVFGITLAVVSVTQKKLANNDVDNEQAFLTAESGAKYLLSEYNRDKNASQILNMYYANNFNTEVALLNNVDLGSATVRLRKGTNVVYVDVKGAYKNNVATVTMKFNETPTQITTGITILNQINLDGGANSGGYTYNGTNWTQNGTVLNGSISDEYLMSMNNSGQTSSVTFNHVNSVPPVTFPEDPSTLPICNGGITNNTTATITQSCRFPDTLNSPFVGTLTFQTNNFINIYIPTTVDVKANGDQGAGQFNVAGSGNVNFYVYQNGSDTSFLFPNINKPKASDTVKANVFAKDALTLTITYNRQNGNRTNGSVFGNVIAPNSTVIFSGMGLKSADQIDAPMIMGNLVAYNLTLDIEDFYAFKPSDQQLNFYINASNTDLPNGYRPTILTFVEFTTN